MGGWVLNEGRVSFYFYPLAVWYFVFMANGKYNYMQFYFYQQQKIWVYEKVYGYFNTDF